MTFFFVSIRMGSAAATPLRTVKAMRPQLISTGSFSLSSNILVMKVPMSISDNCTLRAHILPAGRTTAIRPLELDSDSCSVSPRPVICTRALMVPLVPDSSTPQRASSLPIGVGARRMS